MLTDSDQAREARLRRRAAREGETIHRVRERSRWYSELGPYYVVDDRNRIIASKCDLDTLERDYDLAR
jgi:hypothetical protein